MFITFEGPDGSGKSTILEKVCHDLRSRGIDFLQTREPGGPEISEKIRDLLLDPKNSDLSPRAETLLYAASRAQHIDQWIRPALNQDRLVLSDRFLLSSLAYQGYGRKLGLEDVLSINEFAIGGVKPDHILFFHIDPLVSLERKRRNFDSDRMELEESDFHKAVFEGYQRIIERYKEEENFHIIDASGTVEEVYQNVKGIIDRYLEERE